jgi:uncharacterized protein
VVRIFLDANILFSAAKSDGAIRRLLVMLRSAGHECWADHFVEEEARRNLTGKYGATAGSLDEVLHGVHLSGLTAARDLPVSARRILPEKDQPVLSAAIHLDCDVLLTGDKIHFGPLYGKTFAGVTVHSPASLATALLR